MSKIARLKPIVRPTRSRRWAVHWMAVAVFGCSSPQPDLPLPGALEAPAIEISNPDLFSGEMAKFHRDLLADMGSRSPGSAADQAARKYLASSFESSGVVVEEIIDGDRRHIVGVMRGRSEDALLLIAAYPSLDRDDWIGDSAAALLVELARVLNRERLPYTVHFALADVRTVGAETSELSELKAAEAWAPIDRDVSTDAASDVAGVDRPSVARRRVVSAGESLARVLAERGGFERFRGVLVFDGVGRANLRIARDLRSHPVYREVLWASGRALGFESTFPADAGWASPRSLHLGFKDRAMDRVLAVVDERRARPELAPVRVDQEVSTASFEAVGRVSVEALDRIMHRLSRIDGFGGEKSPPTPDLAPATSEQASPQVPEMPPSS